MPNVAIPKSRLMEDAADLIGLPLKKWPGHCCTVATRFIEHHIVQGRLIYGHWTGPIHEASHFASRRHLPFTHHTWIERRDKRIYDPTRWVFEAVEPYIYAGDNDHYDMAGNNIALAMQRPAPKFNRRAETFPFPRFKPVIALLGLPPYTDEQLFWLSNCHPTQLGGSIRKVYQALIDMGHAAWIPMDNRKYFLGDS